MNPIVNQQTQFIETNQMQMLNEQTDKIFPDLNQSQMNCLSNSLRNEFKRWNDIIDEGTHIKVSEYQYQLIKLDILINKISRFIENNVSGNHIGFDEKETELLIEAIDNEYDSCVRDVGCDSKELDIVIETRDILKEVAIRCFGSDIVDYAHYKSQS